MVGRGDDRSLCKDLLNCLRTHVARRRARRARNKCLVAVTWMILMCRRILRSRWSGQFMTEIRRLDYTERLLMTETRGDELRPLLEIDH
ncbi:hypothetical protein RRG08_008043 [Elysia crispata]|uniref:Uncharacterized protein n=1 Tax=Elysia crispata TaxID=231223 RepID=A0AAE1AH76_9GAST|nr:hypothetical protein RRG08_008043 [Elysia crispata]